MRTCFVVSLLAVLLAHPLAAQATLGDAAQRAAAAWLAHDPETLVGASPNVVLRIPGANPSAPLGGAQAVELLRRYLRPAVERTVLVRALREVSPGSGFVELDRAYAVTGTTDVRNETIYLRYHHGNDGWRLTELRAAP